MLKRMAVVGAVLVAFAGTSQAARWELDKAHSSVGFTVRHLVIAKVNGSFGDFTADIEFDKDNLEQGSVKMTVQVASVDTDDEKRDEHLRSPDFFDAATYPTMVFTSKKVHDVSGDEFKITGDLTIRDVTKEVTFDVEFNGVIDDPWGNTKAAFTATTAINRQDFNVKWNKTLDAGGVLVGDEVKITIELELGMVK
ncbi:MAG: polyisoprenoid-binding protein [Candidatus Zixiibacteriota bacterium]|nr:MAG: polyisoprenoid-binding protein [candidate division Zixibacteria bacterium]